MTRISRPKPGTTGKGALALILALGLFLAGCATTSASPAKSQYMRAETCRRELDKSAAKQAQRHQWTYCVEKFLKVYTLDPNGPWAAAGLYQAGLAYQELHRRSGRESDRAEAVDLFRRVELKFPKSAYTPRARDAATALAESKESVKKQTIRPDAGKIIVAPAPAPVPAPLPPAAPKNPVHPPEPTGNLDELLQDVASSGNSAEEDCPPGPEGVQVTGLRFWTSPNYTRVVIDADGETGFEHHLLRENPELGKPPRLFVDLSGARVGKNLNPIVTIEDDLLSAVRAGQYAPDTVRVVVDIKSFESYKVFPLKNPFRVVIDVRGDKAGDTASRKPAAAPGKPSVGAGAPSPGALARQLALKVNRIVIDPGHGGKDGGAPGAVKGVAEKDVVLTLAKKLAKRVREITGCEVVLTRDSDRYIALEERTAIANSREADLFVSIHTNAHNNRDAYGVETYILNLAADDEAIQVAARENATSKKSVSDLQGILRDLMNNAKIDESTRLACVVQESLVGSLKGKYSNVRDKGVKQAPFYVLLGARMPAILVETSFISNQRECRRLMDSAYQNALVEGIARGIEQYVNTMNHASP
ncbi:MAG: N-acetylmuramoyl-L-alanine amidase [Proteobacteria bacterium]|nr:N-acetylmuramoyl-L-alanine amidase [Pseudomonadota bacterium]